MSLKKVAVIDRVRCGNDGGEETQPGSENPDE